MSCSSRLLFARVFFLALGALAACREQASPPSTTAPATPPPSTAAPAAEPDKPAVVAAASDGDVYFAAMGGHFERVSIYLAPEKFLAEYAGTPEKARNLLTAHWATAEISNGGILQLFSSSAGVLVPEALVGLRALGLGENADVLTEAMKIFGPRYPREHAARYRVVAAHKRQRKVDNPFAELDERFFAALKRHPGGFDAIAAGYARAQP